MKFMIIEVKDSTTNNCGRGVGLQENIQHGIGYSCGFGDGAYEDEVFNLFESEQGIKVSLNGVGDEFSEGFGCGSGC